MGIFRKSKDKNGKPTGPWFIQYPDHRDAKGRIKYKTLKASWQKKKAQEMLRKKQEQFYEAERLGMSVNKEMTFTELMDWGLDQEIMKAKATASDDVRRARHLKAAFGDVMVQRITPLMVDNFRIKMRETNSAHTSKPFSGATVNRMVALARRVFNLGIEAGYLDRNPFARRGKFKEHPKGRYIPDQVFRAIVEELPGYLKPVVLTAYLTGMRRGEIIGLEWDRVDLDNGSLDLTAEDTKTDEPRVIYFDSLPELRRLLVEAKLKMRPRQRLVFTTDDGSRIKGFTVSQWFRIACERAGVGKYRLHDCRHTFCTNLVKTGVGKSTIMRITGHKTLSMFLRYSHLDREQSESAMEGLGSFLSEKRRRALV